MKGTSRIGLALVLTVALVLAAVTWAGAAPFAYITNAFDNTVSVIDTATNAVVGAPISVGSGPYGVAVTSDGSRVYVANSGSNTVSVISTATNTVVATVTVGSSPSGVAVTPDGSRVYVANYFSNTVSVISTATNMVVGAPIQAGSNPYGVAVTPDGSNVYVANSASNNTISVIATATNTVVATVHVGSNPIAFGKFIGGKLDPRLPVPQWFQLGIPNPPGCPPTCPQGWMLYPNNFWGPYTYDDETKINTKTGQFYTIGEEGCALTALITVINFLSGNTTSPTGYPCSICSWPGFPPLDPRTAIDTQWPNNWGAALFDGKAQVKWDNFATWDKEHQVRVYISCPSCKNNTFPIIRYILSDPTLHP